MTLFNKFFFLFACSLFINSTLQADANELILNQQKIKGADE